MLNVQSLAVIAVAFLLAGCGGGGGGAPPSPPPLPTAPTGVQASASDGQVALSWNPVSGATSYNLYWSAAGGTTRASGTRISVATTSATVGGLANEATYYFGVTAQNSTGESAESPEVSAFPIAADTCLATSPATIAGCAAKVQSRTSAVILIRGAIACSGAGACQVDVSGVPITIRGTPGSSIKRSDHQDHPLFRVVDSMHAALSNLIIDEDATVACTPVTPTNPPVENTACAATVDLRNVSDLSDRMTIANSKSVAVSLTGGNGNASVTHSRFVSPYLFGLYIDRLTGSLLVKDSLFVNAASNAFVMNDAHGTSQAPLLITHTFFEHNHRADVYFVCGPQANEQCSGGQLFVYGNVDFFRVEGSVIRDGSTDANDTPVGGVELTPQNVRDVTFAENDIHAHGMWGAYANPAPSNFARVSFTNNKLYDNGRDPAYLGVDIGNFPGGTVTETGTCHTANCRAVPLGELWALPDRTVSWVSNDLASPSVSVNGTPVATTANGHTVAPAGATVLLLDGTTEIDRLVVL